MKMDDSDQEELGIEKIQIKRITGFSDIILPYEITILVMK
jgi:hypothetical protein